MRNTATFLTCLLAAVAVSDARAQQPAPSPRPSAVSAAAAASTASAARPSAPAISLRGGPVSERKYEIVYTTGPMAAKVIHVYAEPSHTLLMLAVDAQFRATPEGAAWIAANTDAKPLSMTTSPKLAGSTGTLTFIYEPKNDNRIVTKIYASWPDGKTEQRVVSDASVGSLTRRFSFSSTAP